MLFPTFKFKIKDLSDQFHVVQVDDKTEVHWIYGGFDIYEAAQKHPYRVHKSTGIKHLSDRMKQWISSEDNEPMFHVIAEISEVDEHAVAMDISPYHLPEHMRKRVAPLIAAYVATPLTDRTQRIQATIEPQVESGFEKRQREKNENKKYFDDLLNRQKATSQKVR